MGKLALVTGASSGIGRATARLLGAEGWSVILVARRAEPLERLAKEIAASGGAARVEALDAGDGAAVRAMAERVLAVVGCPDVIVHSAGAGRWLFLDETGPDEAQAMLSAPFFAAFHVTAAFLGAMVERGAGVVVHVNSPASSAPWAGATGYTCSRWALRGLHEALRQDLVGTGVHTCHVVFGEVSSDYFQANPGSRERLPGIARWIPVMSPDDCAATLARIVDRPRPETFAPTMLQLFHFTRLVAPWLVRWMITLTQARRSVGR